VLSGGDFERDGAVENLRYPEKSVAGHEYEVYRSL
jgi:hypothetical protein